MKPQDALKIVLELAEEAVETACADNSGMAEWRAIQLRAIYIAIYIVRDSFAKESL